MTALHKYQRLESPGLWREQPAMQARDVVVAFQEATLVLSDPRSEMALSHWSLPAIERLNPGELPALFAPGPDAEDRLEIDDTEMIAALDTVRRVLVRRRARPGRLRGVILTGTTIAVLGLGLIWMPGALVRHTASVLPTASRSAIGAQALAELARLTGSPCATPLGQRAAAALAARLFGRDTAVQIIVLREGLVQSASLPGGLILLGRGLVETPPDAETAAGFALAEAARSAALDPIIPLLQHAGLPATFRLLTTGTLPRNALTGYAEALLRNPPGPLPTEQVLPQFAAAEVTSTPYAYALDATGESVLTLIEADPFQAGSPRAVLADGEWISLQSICSE